MNSNPPPLSPPEPSYGRPLLLRWRGREEGPIAWAEIERRLAANDIGLFHEVQVDGAWMPLRAFLELREAARQEAKARREEAERVANEYAARAAEERASRHQSEVLAEEKRKNDLMAAALGLQRRQPWSWAKLFRNVAIVLFLLAAGMAAFQVQRIPGLEAALVRLKAEAASLKIDDNELMTMAGFNVGFRVGESLFESDASILDALQRGLGEAAQKLKGELELHGMRVQQYRTAISRCTADRDYAPIARNWSVLVACASLIAIILFQLFVPKRIKT